MLAACSGVGKPGETYFSDDHRPAQPLTVQGPQPAAPAAVLDSHQPAPCTFAIQCASGVCEGLGCTAEAPGHCAPDRRACTRDRRAYCGCDGKTFFSSSSCPGDRYASTGECPAKP
jgi:hypothetical protein